MTGDPKMPWIPVHELRPVDLIDHPIPGHDAIRADVAASGGATLTTNVVPSVAAVLGGHDFRIAGGEVLCVPRGAAGGLRPLSAALVRDFLANHIPAWVRVTADVDVDEVVDQVRATVLADHAEAVARVPDDVRRGSELDAEQRRADRLAEIERMRAALADEEADLASGGSVVDETTGTSAWRGWRRRGAP